MHFSAFQWLKYTIRNVWFDKQFVKNLSYKDIKNASRFEHHTCTVCILYSVHFVSLQSCTFVKDLRLYFRFQIRIYRACASLLLWSKLPYVLSNFNPHHSVVLHVKSGRDQQNWEWGICRIINSAAEWGICRNINSALERERKLEGMNRLRGIYV